MATITEVFTLSYANRRAHAGDLDRGQLVWQAIVDGIVIPAEFMSKGAAEAAIPVERARRLRRAAKVTV